MKIEQTIERLGQGFWSVERKLEWNGRTCQNGEGGKDEQRNEGWPFCARMSQSHENWLNEWKK